MSLIACMPSLPNNGAASSADRWRAAIFALVAVVYPAAVYWLHVQVSFAVFAIAAILLLILRSLLVVDGVTRLLRLPLLCAALVLAVLAVIDSAVAAKIYPALLSLLIATLFGNSLRHPPSLVERIARLREPVLPPVGIVYCRRVTWIWTLWLLANAMIAGLLALAQDLALWALWTGLISYLCSAVLFAGERLLRPMLMRRAAR
ncbi:hypothetical protein [Dongia sp.]|uniref:hypothetical protein n=1 Tax=Dongia sp. TaxID=1977262 RepID=UPI0035B4F278